MALARITHPAASTGIAIGQAHLLRLTQAETPRYWLTEPSLHAEIERLRTAAAVTRTELTKIRNSLSRFQSEEQRQILEMHILLTEDEMFLGQAIRILQERAICAEWALEKTIAQLGATLAGAGEAYLRDRQGDIEQVGRRILRHLTGATERLSQLVPYPATILVAHDLGPADLVHLQRRNLKGLITAKGGATSHIAIIARSLQIPAILGTEEIFLAAHEGDPLILNATDGEILVRPTAHERAAFRQRQRRRVPEHLRRERTLPAVTTDDVRIHLAANLGLADEMAAALQHGAEEIGMLRTEYLFLYRPDLPTEEEQLHQYRTILERYRPRPVTIRLLDIGGDKTTASLAYPIEPNPALGLRGIRLSLRERDVLVVQLRALYRASPVGPLRLLFPMISTIEEWQAVRTIIREVQESLRRERHDFDADVPLGVMIEVPAAALLVEAFAPLVDFFSIGTNDLTQYTLAADRGNDQVASLYSPLHPAVLRLVCQVVATARSRNLPVSVCGEMAGDPRAARVLLGFGVTHLSMAPHLIPTIKHTIRTTSFAEQQRLATQLLQATTAQEVLASLPPVA